MVRAGYEVIDELPDLINKPVFCERCGGKFIRVKKKDKLCPICRQKGKQNEYAEMQIRETLRLAEEQRKGD